MKKKLIILFLATIMVNVKSTDFEEDIKTEEEISLEKEGEELTKKLDKVRTDKEKIIKESRKKDDTIKQKDYVIKQKDDAIKQKDDAIKQKDDAIKQKDDLIKEIKAEKEKALEKVEKIQLYLKSKGIDPDTI